MKNKRIMKTKKQIEVDKYLKERLDKGQELLSTYSSETIFEGMKKIVRQHIPASSIPSLDSCSLYRIIVNEKKVREIFFYFGGVLNGYEVSLTARTLRFSSRNYFPRPKEMYSCSTLELIKVITKE